MMPAGMATTTHISRLSEVPPRATQRRLAMTIPTMIPAMMDSAYARSGKPKTCQTPLGGLRMNSGTTYSITPSSPIGDGDSSFLRGVGDLLVQLVDGQGRDVDLGVPDEHRRRLVHARTARRLVDRVDPGLVFALLDARLEAVRRLAAGDLIGQRDQLGVAP